MNRHQILPTFLIGLSLASLASAGDSPVNLAEIREVIAKREGPALVRGKRVLEVAALLDQAAMREVHPTERRARWSEAVGLIDMFLTNDENTETNPLIPFQGAVYCWASGRSGLDYCEFHPSEREVFSNALNDLDDAYGRFKKVQLPPTKAGEPVDLLTQNVRFRMAQALSDRSRIRREDDPLKVEQEREAQKLLDPAPTAPSLRGFALMLKADLSNRLSQFGRAAIEIDEAEKCDPPPSAALVAESKVASLCGRQSFEEARKLVAAGTKLDPALQSLLLLRIELARRRQLSPGRSRESVDADAFRVAMSLRGSNRLEARRGLIELAREIDQAPAAGSPDWWDLLAEGHLGLGDSTRAGRLLAKGADRALAMGQAEQAATLRFKGGACLYEAGKFTEAERLLAQVVDLKTASRETQARAGMLRALALGRAVATGLPEASRDAYLGSLENQIRSFPEAASSGEARWLLGRIRWNAGRRDEAVALWSGIVHGHPRWLESRLEVAGLLREEVEEQAVNHDSAAIKSKLDYARESLNTARREAIEGSEAIAIDLCLARLELVPGVGGGNEALSACDRLLKGAARPDQHRQARLYRMIALAETSRFVEAEAIARVEAKTAEPGEVQLALRTLDRAATNAESEPSRRRIGLILQVFTTRYVARIDELPATLRDQARLRHVRALLFAGNTVAARKELIDWGGASGLGDNEFLRDLADTYLRLDAFGMAIEVEKLRSSRLKPGSILWFEARYGLALASYRAGKSKDARQVIDATAILHPELGGGDLRPRFERLRQRIEQE